MELSSVKSQKGKTSSMKLSTITITSALAVGLSAIHPITAILSVFLILLILADVVSGLLLAADTGSVSSDASRHGLIRKGTLILGVLVNASFIMIYHAAEHVSGKPLSVILPIIGEFDADSVGAVIPALCCLYETISIVENTARLGFPWPKVFVKSLVKLKQETPAATAEDIRELGND